MLELLGHLHFEKDTKDILETVVNVIPCMMPYIDSQFQPRAKSDRPLVVPEGSTNFAMISQFVAVSYTHLDVYKRQAIKCLIFQDGIRMVFLLKRLSRN